MHHLLSLAAMLRVKMHNIKAMFITLDKHCRFKVACTFCDVFHVTALALAILVMMARL